MKPPTTSEELLALHQLSVVDPARFIEIANDWISANPTDAHAYFDRHLAWMRLGQTQEALKDINKSIKLVPSPMALKARGDLHRRLGEYPLAARDYAQGEAIDPEQWAADALPLLYQADAHARMGDEPMALAYCARLPDNFWTPGHNELPAGGKDAISAELKRRASEAGAAAASL